MDKFTGVVVEKFETGVVLNPKDSDNAGVGYFVPVGELLGSTDDARQEALRRITVGEELRVAIINEEPVQSCSDGVWRPVASVWQIEAARRAHERTQIVDAVKAWDKKGGGNATVIEVQAERGFCLVQPEGETFVGLLHVKDMAGELDANNARLSSQLKAGDKLSVDLKEEPRVKKFRPAIRFKEKSA